jgi:hypothetical protein
MSTSTRSMVRTPRTRVITPRQQLDIAVTVIPEDAPPSEAYLSLWRRLLAPLPAQPSPPPPASPPDPAAALSSLSAGKGARRE